MTMGPGDDERSWAADKRDFVAEWRDGAADGRDAAADARDSAADAREAELDEWERRLEERAAELGMAFEGTATSAARRERRTAREQARQHRSNALRDRSVASAERDDATKRRLADARPTLLALAFASVAEQLYNAENVDDVFTRIAQAAVSTVNGCGLASITLAARSGGYRTAASTAPAATAVDTAQYGAGEGPCLDAAIGTSMVHVEVFPDERYPLLGAQPIDSGVHSAVSYRLATAAADAVASEGGSLNAYGLTAFAFDDTAQEIGFVLAAHAAVAVRAVGERDGLKDAGQDLYEALMARDVIGQAKGILMERLRVTPEEAFDVLRRASQRLNVKLREVARKLSETGEFPHGG